MHSHGIDVPPTSQIMPAYSFCISDCEDLPFYSSKRVMPSSTPQSTLQSSTGIHEGEKSTVAFHENLSSHRDVMVPDILEGNGEKSKGSNDSSSFDSDTTYILAAVGGVLVIILTATLLLSIMCTCMCRSRQNKTGIRLRRNSTTRSSSASEFVYNSAYEWTYKQSRVLTHLQPDPTGYQTHWSLTRDIHVAKQSKDATLQHTDSHEDSDSQLGGLTNGALVKYATSTSTHEVNFKTDAEDSEAKREYIVIENCYSHIEANETARETEKLASESSSCAEPQRATDIIDSSSHSKLPYTEQRTQEEEDHVYDIPDPKSLYHFGTENRADTCSMYSNPLYAKKELDRKRDRENLRKGEREGEEEEGERGEERGKENEEEEERGEESEGEEERGKESEEEEERGEESEEEESEEEEEREEEEMRRMETNLEGDRVSKASTVYYSMPVKPISTFLISDNEAYDSGNASAVSTELSTSIQKSDCRCGAYISRHSTTMEKSRGVVKSNSFEFTNNVAYVRVVK